MEDKTETRVSEQRQTFEKLHAEICTNIRALDDNSFRLLSFVPLVTGSAIGVVLLKAGTRFSWVIVLLSLVGAIVTFGLYRWERRNVQICKWLQGRADEIERDQFGITSGKEQFAIRTKNPSSGFEDFEYKDLHIFHGFSIYQRSAERIIYWAAISAWLLLPVAVYFTEKCR